MKKFIATLLVLSITISGCITGRFTYPGNNVALKRMYNEPHHQKSVVVVPVSEGRKIGNNFSESFRYLIPLTFKASFTYYRPESANAYNTIENFEFTPNIDITKAVHATLEHSNLFQTVRYAHSYNENDYDYVLEGQILSTKYTGDIYPYGLSVFGPLLWLFGIPAGASHNELSIQMTMKKISSQEIIWQYTFTNNFSIRQGLYHNYGKDVSGYPELLGNGLKDAFKDLDNTLNSNS